MEEKYNSHPWPLFVYFLPSQTKDTIFTTCECVKYPSSVWQDSNQQLFAYYFPHLTTSPLAYLLNAL